MVTNSEESTPRGGGDAAAGDKKLAINHQARGKMTVKILMLHGYTQSGPLFHNKTRALEKILIKSLAPFKLYPELIYPTAPNRLRPSDIPGFNPPAPEVEGPTLDRPRPEEEDPNSLDSWAWWRRDDATGSYRLLPEGMLRLASAISAAGGVHGVVGFSQGGAMAALLASVLEQPHRGVPPPAAASSWDWVPVLRAANKGEALRFAVSYSGFYATPADLAWLYEPPLRTPTLHFIGSLDTVVEESRSRALAERCVDSVVFTHPGGHFVPFSKECAMTLVGFLKQQCEPYVKAAEIEAAATKAAETKAEGKEN